MGTLALPKAAISRMVDERGDSMIALE